jgi:ribosome biogenesis SPOUT family RNA methylase Rps3
MRNLAGPDAELHFTHLSSSSTTSLSMTFENSPDKALIAKAFCHQIGVLELINQSPDHVSIEKVCLLDPKAITQLSPEDGDGRFQWFLFGVCVNFPHLN